MIPSRILRADFTGGAHLFESLHSLSDSQIITGTKVARAQEHSGLLSMIGFIIETERRQLFLRRGYSCLFDYCMKELGYSESQAIRRITAARCITRFPDVFELLKANEINLGTISRVSKILTPENCGDVLESIRKKSLREVEAIVAEHEPVAAFPRDRVRTIVARVPLRRALELGENHLRNEGEKHPSLDELTLNEKPCESLAAAPGHLPQSDQTKLPGQDQPSAIASAQTPESSSAQPNASVLNVTENFEPLSADRPRAVEEERKPDHLSTENRPPAPVSPANLERRVRVEFTARQQMMEKLERIRVIASHRLRPGASMEQLIDFMADYVILREDPIKRHERREARRMKIDREAE